MIAGDGALDSPSKSADYYQSYSVVVRKEAELEISSLYFFSSRRFGLKAAIVIPLVFLSLQKSVGFKIGILIKRQILLHQNIISFIKQAVFVNEIDTSKDFYTGLYSA